MVQIKFTEPKDPRWHIWCAKCDAETERLKEAVAANQAPDIKELYKEDYVKRNHFFVRVPDKPASPPFYNKCAYCEDNLESHQGDIDHYRPKKRVLDKDGMVVTNHKGYYWLAYDWHNLLPSCKMCNTHGMWKEKGIANTGKIDYFPLLNEDRRVYSPGDLSKEQPLLINPLVDNPDDHLEVDISSGFMRSKSAQGAFCIDIFGLNKRGSLMEGRRNAIRTAYALITHYFSCVTLGNNLAIVQSLQEILRYANGEKTFSLAARCYFRQAQGNQYKAFFEERLNDFQSIIGPTE